MRRVEAIDHILGSRGDWLASCRLSQAWLATVTRAVSQLEVNSGVRLIERTTRRFAVTETGARHVEKYRKILGELAHLEAQSPDTSISGTVVVTAPELFGRMRVMPVIERFLAIHPDTEVRLLLLNRVVVPVGEGVDVAIRVADLPGSSMTAIKVGEIRRLTCAAPCYLAKNPPPTYPAISSSIPASG